MAGVSSRGEHGRRAQRRQAPPRAPVGPVLGWVVFTLVVAVAVLLLAGLALLTVLGLLAAGAVVGGVLLAAVRFSPPADGADADRGDGGAS